MNDYRKIAFQRKPWKRFLPGKACQMHQVSRQFIQSVLQDDDNPAVVVTHHLPHPRSIPGRFEGDMLNAAFASDLSDVIEAGQPALWVHGHIHDSCDYKINGTRVFSNPRGYGNENAAFDDAFVLEV